ncbi:MAG: LptF/LptG family permease [Planctomycetota bacterium]
MRNPPWIIYRYAGREVALIFAISLAALSLLFMIISGIRAVNAGFALRIIMPWIIESLGFSLFFTVPISLLVASTLGYGRMVADKEYTAATASGISPLHLFVPMAALSLSLTVVALLTHGEVLPRAHYIQRNIARYLVKQLEHLGDSKKGQLPLDKKDGLVYWDEVIDGTQLRGVHIEKRLPVGSLKVSLNPEHPLPYVEESEKREGKGGTQGKEEELYAPTYIKARRALLEVDKGAEMVNLTLKDVDVTYPNIDQGFLFPEFGTPRSYERFYFKEFMVQFPINEKKKREGDWTNRELRAAEREYRRRAREHKEALRSEIDPEKREKGEKLLTYYQRRIGKARCELWRRRALALSVFSFAFLGFPISLTFRHRHRLVAFFVGTMLVVAIFYPLLLMGETLTKELGIPAILTMLSGNLALLSIAGFMTGRLLLR